MTNTLGERYLWTVAERVSNISEKLLDNLASLQKDVRNKAFNILIKDFWDDMTLFQTAPMGFLENQDTEAAISFLIAAFEQNKQIDIEVFKQVYYTILSELAIATQENDQEIIEVISEKLNLLFQGAAKQLNYKENLDFLCVLYDEKMRLKDYWSAHNIAQELVKRNHPLWYLLVWKVYSEESLLDKTMEAFVSGWEKHKVQIYLEQIVILSYKMWDLETSQKYYEMWVKTFSKMWYFIEYSQEITSWEEFEMFLKHIFPNSSHDYNKNLMASAIEFLKEELLQEQEVHRNSKNDNPKRALQSLFQSLKIGYYLSEYSKNTQFFWYHIHQLKQIWSSNDPHFHEILEEFLERFADIKVQYEMAWEEGEDAKTLNNKFSSENNQTSWFEFEVKQSQTQNIEQKLKLETHLILYIYWQMRPFLSHENQWALTQWVFPFLHELEKEVPENEQKEGIQTQLLYTEEFLEKEAHFFASLPESMKQIYREFIQEMDDTYGVFVRRNIQSLAKNFKIPQEMNYSEWVLLHCVEFLIARYIKSWLSSQDIWTILKTYDIFSLQIDHTQLNFLWELLYHFEAYDAAMEIFIHSHIQFQDETSFYNILKIKFYMNDETFHSFMKILKEKWEISENITDYFRKYIGDTENWELKSLCEWMYHALFSNEKEYFSKAEKIFQTVAQNWNIEGTLWLAKLSEVAENITWALSYYEQAFEQNPQNTRYLKECLRVAFFLEDKEKIEYFIQKASLYNYRDFETEYFMYLLEYKTSWQAIQYSIACFHKDISISFSEGNVFWKIYAIATRDSLASKEWFFEKISAQIAFVLQSWYQIPYQLLFLSTLLQIPDEYFLEWVWKAFDMMYNTQTNSNIESILEHIHNFSQTIAYNTIEDDRMLALIRDFYYQMMKLAQKIPGWEKQMQTYMDKLDIPYLKGNFCVLPNELSSKLYH